MVTLEDFLASPQGLALGYDGLVARTETLFRFMAEEGHWSTGALAATLATRGFHSIKSLDDLGKISGFAELAFTTARQTLAIVCSEPTWETWSVSASEGLRIVQEAFGGEIVTDAP